MFKKGSSTRKNIKVCLLGASFHTGNMGVSALAESSIKIILNRWPDAEITLLGVGYTPHEDRFFISEREVRIETLPIRFSKNIFLSYHFLVFVFYGLLSKVLPGSTLKNALVNRNSCYKTLCEADIAVDITGGDSFSDIYGFRRFFLGFLCKWLVIFLGKKLVFLPQTYGPFKMPLAKAMAKYILKKATLVYSRDMEGVEYVNKLLNKGKKTGKVGFAPDVAFVLDSRKPERLGIEPSANIRVHNSMVVGLNISGLLFNGGYTRNNMFDLKSNYRELIYAVIEMLLKDKNTVILLIPHVFPPAGYEVESDPLACSEVYQELNGKYHGRIFLAQGDYNHNEIKYIIGLCDFFVGSRMHSCIAALSQCIPTVGLAYSSKFQGVFFSVGCSPFVVDIRQKDREEILDAIAKSFQQREFMLEHLKDTVPGICSMVMDTLVDMPEQGCEVERPRKLSANNG